MWESHTERKNAKSLMTFYCFYNFDVMFTVPFDKSQVEYLRKAFTKEKKVVMLNLLLFYYFFMA